MFVAIRYHKLTQCIYLGSIFKMINYLENFWNSKFLPGCLLCLSLGIANVAMAEYKKPPNTENDAPDASATSISGIRGGGCHGTETTNLTAIAPYTHIGQTNSTHPTFTWFVPDRASYPVELQVAEYSPFSSNGKGKTIFRVRLKSNPGIMSYSLPQDQLSLSSAQKYVWQIAILCNPNRPSEDLVVSTEIMVVKPSTNLQKQLTTATDYLAQANLYAEAGLWYDALAKALEKKHNPQAQKLVYELIAEMTIIEQLNQENNINTNDVNEQRKIMITRQEHQKRLEQILEFSR